LDPRGELPSPPFSSLSLFLFLPFPSPRAPPSSPMRACPSAAPRARPMRPPSPLACGPCPPLVRGPDFRQRGPGPWRRGSLAPRRGLGPLTCGPSVPVRAAVLAPVRGLYLRQRGPPTRPLRTSRRGLAPPVHPTHSRVRSPTLAVIYSWFLINFKPCLVSVLRRVLHRATNLFNFRFY
jgi:hypothetical protein